MSISNTLLEEMIENIKSYKDALERDRDADSKKKKEITKELIKISTRRAEIRKSLGFDLYQLYYELAKAIMEENYEGATFLRDQILDY